MKYYEWSHSSKYAVLEAKNEFENALSYKEISDKADNWQPIEVIKTPESEKNRKQIQDMNSSTSFSFILRENVLKQISIFSKFGSALPLINSFEDSNLFLYVCNNVVDALNLESSELKMSYLNPENITTIIKPVFNQSAINNSDIFVTKQVVNQIFVSERLVDKVRSEKLKGMFIKESFFGKEIEVK